MATIRDILRGDAPAPAWTAAALVGVITFAFYLALWPRITERLDPLTGDEPFYVMTAISLLEDRDLDESNNYSAVTIAGETGPYTLYAFDDLLNPPEPLPLDWKGWENPPRLVGAHAATTDRPGLYTKHGIGLSAMIAVPWAVAGRFGANAFVMVVTALLAAQMFILARESGATTWLAGGIALALATAMPIGPYAFLLFPEAPAALLLVYAIRRAAAPDHRWWQWLLAGAAVGFLPWLHQRFAPTAVVLTAILIALFITHRDTLRTAALALAPIALGGVSLLAFNQWLYGQPLQRTEDHAGFNGLAGTINGGFGLLLDAQWGLLVAAPVMLLAMAAFPRWLHDHRRVASIALAASLPYLLVVAAYSVWWGEWGPPARYLVPLVPLAAGPLGTWLAAATALGRLAAYALWAAGMLLTIAGYQDPQRFYHHPDGVNHLVTHVGEQLGVDLQRVLVAFQFYSAAPLAARFWMSATLVILLVVVTWTISGGHTRRVARNGSRDLLRTLRVL